MRGFACSLLIVFCAPFVRAQDAESSDADVRLWSLAPLLETEVPAPKDASTARSDVDRFLLARLDREGLEPAGPADPHSLLRRVTIDLTGLPPTPRDIAEFVANPSDAAFVAVVERLLASSSFGERWGRHWLDVARFAESSGGGRSLMFENAWRYRDYVIDAYNEDRPFDVFLQEQIAGDLLPFETATQRNRQLVATGFLELGPTNYELQDKELLRMDVIDEQIDTVGQAFLGLTLGCARCHDHKFDPVPMRDYYALAGIFGSTEVLKPGNVSGWNEEEFVGERTQAWQAWRARVVALEKQIAKHRGANRRTRRATQRVDTSSMRGIVLDDVAAEKTGVWIPSTSVQGYVDLGYIHDENTEKGQKAVRFRPRFEVGGLYEVRVSYTPGSNRATNVPVVIEHAGGRKRVLIDQREEPSLDGAFVSVGRYRFEAGVQATITFSNEATDGHVVVDAVHLEPVDSLVVPENREGRALAALQRELRSMKKAEPPRPQRAMAVRDGMVADSRLLRAGLVRARGERIPRGFLSTCGGEKPAIPDDQSGRLQLAQWLTSPSHPLTARVYVNRVWHWLFGAGLVRTVDNFGARGERPSHPELLDWLARRFVQRGWSTKQLIRDLVLSSAYQQRVTESPSRDPENRLLSHFNRRRLDAEAIRDTILHISGELDPAQGGKTIRKMSQYDYAYVFDSRRRSVYVPRFRSNRLDLFDVFDAPDPSMVAGARNVSNVAPQALYLMNSAWVMHQAARAAARHFDDSGDVRMLNRAYQLTLGRPPSVDERRIAMRYLVGAQGAHKWSGLFQALFASLDFRYLH